LPPVSSDQLVGYLEGRAVFGNPTIPGTGYVYVQGLPPLSEIQNPEQVIVAFEEKSNRPEGTNALFLDGHVGLLPKTPEQIRQQVLQESAGRPLGFEVARGDLDSLSVLGYVQAGPPGAARSQAAQKEMPADEFRGAERQRLNEEMLKAKYEREADKRVEGKGQQEAFLLTTVVRVPEAQAVTEVKAGRAQGAMPMLLSLPTGGERYRLYQPFVEREPGGFTLTLLARGPFQWVRALLFLVLAGGFVTGARRWPRGGLAAGGAMALVLLLVDLTSTGGVRLLSEAALGATVVSLVVGGIIYQRRQSAHGNPR
jgi:prepilin-type processing-associated H-X9-DG protein